ncbi:MAG: cysteine--tRNA ligase [Candidatus Sungbacteria bacterium]|nr:cysteine--tRNA ligase [bacterium]MDZ4260659.1 cysteine--tRNA ligase [Candidatus Sungbacteria bacterium]
MPIRKNVSKKIALYNVLTRRKEAFKPIRKDWVGLYTCGPTVYNFAHIGNLRTYIFEDILRRTLEYAGFKVRHVMNLTDVDDKIIRDAASADKTIVEFVKPYEQAFFEDVKKLNIEPAWKYAKATEHIDDMVKLIRTLLKKGIAYQMDGSVYFSIKTFKPYGKLSRVSSRQLQRGVPVDADEYTKKDIQDFALWKGKKEGEPSWVSPFGEGHPGWHIECSAMSMKYLGNTFDIHGGGVDLIFPHHENEIAQSSGATGHPFARFFMEGEHLLVNGEKMSKSLGNVFTLRDFEAKKINPLSYRYLALTSHYRSKLNFTWESLESAGHSLEKLYDFIRSLKAEGKMAYRSKKKRTLTSYQKKFEQAVFDDLHTSRALAVVWSMIHSYHKTPQEYDSKEFLTLLYNFDRIFGLKLTDVSVDVIPPFILDLVREREIWRKAKDWKKADEIREKIKEAGYEVEDSSEGPNVKKI